MAHFYFDIRADDVLESDPDGLELKGLENAKQEAVKVLVDLAKEALPSVLRQKLSVEVRNGDGNLVFRTVLLFAAEQFA